MYLYKQDAIYGFKVKWDVALIHAILNFLTLTIYYDTNILHQSIQTHKIRKKL